MSGWENLLWLLVGMLLGAVWMYRQCMAAFQAIIERHEWRRRGDSGGDE